MTKKRAPMLICVALLIIMLTTLFFAACTPESEGDDTSGGNTQGAGTNDSDIDTTEQTTEPVADPGTDSSALDTEPPAPVEITVTVSEASLSLEAEKTHTLTLTLAPADAADTSLLTAMTVDDKVASAEISFDDAGLPELTVTAVGAGVTSVEVLYDGVVLAEVSVQVAEKVVEQKPLPPAQMPDEIDPSLPMLAITFDDGPGKYTGELLDILKKHNVHVTFFVLGNMINKRESVMKRAVNDGHEIGIHTWDHTKLTTLSKEKIRWEVTSVRDLLEEIAGYTPRLMRPPYGSANDDVKAVAKEEGFIVVRWNIDTEDWKTRNADATYEAIMGSAKDGAIILCHDIHKETIEAMDRTIDALLREGYQLVTVSELLEYGKTKPAAGDVVSSRK